MSLTLFKTEGGTRRHGCASARCDIAVVPDRRCDDRSANFDTVSLHDLHGIWNSRLVADAYSLEREVLKAIEQGSHVSIANVGSLPIASSGLLAQWP